MIPERIRRRRQLLAEIQLWSIAALAALCAAALWLTADSAMIATIGLADW